MATSISRTWYDTLIDDDGSGTTGSIWDKADVDALLDAIDALFTTAHTIYINDTANAMMTVGVTINQAGNDDEILAVKSSDVAHGCTTTTEADTFGTFSKYEATTGSLLIRGFNDVRAHGLVLQGVGDGGVGTRSTAAEAPTMIEGMIRSGTSIAAVGADQNLVVIRNGTTTRFIFDADGDSHQDVGTAWTNFDDGDDIARLDAVAVTLAREGDPLREAFVRSFEEHRAVLEAMPGKPLIVFNADGHHFVNMSRLTMLHTGAIRQTARALDRVTRVLLAAGVVTQAQLEAA